MSPGQMKRFAYPTTKRKNTRFLMVRRTCASASGSAGATIRCDRKVSPLRASTMNFAAGPSVKKLHDTCRRRRLALIGRHDEAEMNEEHRQQGERPG